MCRIFIVKLIVDLFMVKNNAMLNTNAEDAKVRFSELGKSLTNLLIRA